MKRIKHDGILGRQREECVSRYKKERGRVDKSQEEEGGIVCGRDGMVVSTVLLVQSFESRRDWCTCCRPQTSFLEIKTTHILRTLRGTR
jgi:hypothetical protein